MKYSINAISIIGLFLISQLAYPDSITDTYSSGDTLTATTLNNIKSAVNGNDSNITINTLGISGNDSKITINALGISDNESNITNNASNISNNTSNISTNVSNITSNTSDIADNAFNITTNQQNITINDNAITDNAANILANTTRITGSFYLSIPAFTCVSATPTTHTLCAGAGVTRTEGSFQWLCRINLASVLETYGCPLHLPHGAAIEEITLFGSDSSTDGYFEGGAMSHNINNFGASVIGSGTWSNSGITENPGSISVTILSLSDPDVIIDNFTKKYSIQFGGRNAAVDSIRVRYRID